MTMPTIRTNIPSGGLMKMRVLDTFGGMLGGHLKTRSDLYPLFSFIGIWAVGFAGIVYWSFSKMEVQINRSKPHKTYEWERASTEAFRKWHFYDPHGDLTKIPKELAEVQAEMLKAKQAKAHEKAHH